MHPLGVIAVSTEDLEALRVPLSTEPAEDLDRTSNFLPMGSAVVFDVVDLQELPMPLPAARAGRIGASVGVQGGVTKFISVPLSLGQFVLAILLVLGLHSIQVALSLLRVLVPAPIQFSSA